MNTEIMLAISTIEEVEQAAEEMKRNLKDELTKALNGVHSVRDMEGVEKSKICREHLIRAFELQERLEDLRAVYLKMKLEECSSFEKLIAKTTEQEKEIFHD